MGTKKEFIGDQAIIGHLDMDAFFAAVEERGNPRFKGLPLVVGADPKEGQGRGVVSTANYAARKFGIHSGMPITRAWKLSQEAKKRGEDSTVFLPTNHKRYSEISNEIMEIVRKHVKRIEQVGIDESYLDFTFAKTYKKAASTARAIKKDVYKKEKLTCSIGIGPNKLIAKIASDRKKPDGLTVITPDQVIDFLAPLSVRKMPGIGPKTEETLKKMDIELVRDIQALSPMELIDQMGRSGEDLYKKAQGMGSSTIATKKAERKSIGEQETFETDTLDAKFLLTVLEKISERVWGTFSKKELSAFKTVTITVRFSNFKTVTRSHTFSAPNPSKEDLKRTTLQLFLPFLDSRENPKHHPIRLLGVRVENIIPKEKTTKE